MTYKDAVKIINKKFYGQEVIGIYQTDELFIICLQPYGVNKQIDMVTDSIFSVNKKSGIVKEYAPLLDPENFNKAYENPIFIKKMK